ncbi:SGNH/GDSL hydrolase family protein [Ahrensia sp. R2A130]|uniref:SGNH/GDSL hydrolase family protein n=1 Tax=Ahrensia sp. R2A130 TaxID=744979 RepID=UPI0001E0B527|nr:SGNH/GDSL hydrolase family protein [Ahrensia sp. R2A130]EFL87787.1 putative gdsl family lipase [Ahrensia sp. R2A130]
MNVDRYPLAAKFLSWLLFLPYVAQGIWVRSRSLRLSPAAGPRSGVYGSGKPAVSILTVGDSSGAAVGIEHTDGSIGAQIARKWHERRNETAHWHISGHNSAVASELRDYVVPNLEPVDYTHIFIMLGTNDMKNWHTTGRWKRDFGSLLYALRTRFPESKIYWHQAIDISTAPALPAFLGWVMNLRVGLFNRIGAQLCVERGVVCIPPLPVEDPSGFCRDGFHANELGYDYWSDHMMKFVDETPRSTPPVQDYIRE